MGDAHIAQGDSEFDGTGIETSITGRFKITLHKKGRLPKTLRVRRGGHRNKRQLSWSYLAGMLAHRNGLPGSCASRTVKSAAQKQRRCMLRCIAEAPGASEQFCGAA
jgi:acetamidase/formamidase